MAGSMDETRRRTLETLIELAEGFDAVGCWDPERAIELLRRETTTDELAQIGADETLINQVWPGRQEEKEKR